MMVGCFTGMPRNLFRVWSGWGLIVTVRILIQGQDEQKIDCEVMDKRISVEVNPTYTIKRFIECYWQWIIGTIISAIVIIPIILRLVKRSRKK
jgi:hypothetical protein